MTTTSPRDGGTLDGDAYERWVRGYDVETDRPKGRLRTDERAMRFVEVVVNGPKTWSLAAALHPEVAAAYDAAPERAAVEIIGWLAENCTTRVGPLGRQVQVPVERLEAAVVRHYTSRAGDPHRHLHLQVNARVYAQGRWRGLYSVGVVDSIEAMLRRALAAVPAPVRAALAETGQVPRARVDAGYFTGDLAHAAVDEGCDFAIAAKRNTAMWRAYASIDADAWVDAKGMPGAQVAAVDYAPGGWPEDSYTIVRRVRVEAEAISTDPRSRRRRTIDPDQLALALEGTATHAYAVSFIVTNIPTHEDSEKGETVVEVEAWFRRRTDIEDRIREAKLGAALRHLPAGHAGVNTVWTWAALLAGNLSVLLQALTRIDDNGRARGARLRHQLLCVPARLVRHGRVLTLRLPPGDHLLPTVLARIRQLDTAA